MIMKRWFCCSAAWGLLAILSCILLLSRMQPHLSWDRILAGPSREMQTKQTEKHHIVFLKVHKAASTTVQNILLRFAMSHNLSVLLNMRHNHINESGTFINPKSLIAHPKGQKYDILTNHIVFNYEEIAKYFPKDTVYVGIVREPFEQFRSAFAYYGHVWRYSDILRCVRDNPQDTITHFLRDPLHYSAGNPRHKQLNNRMMVDFGFPLGHFEKAKADTEKIEAFVSGIHKIFDLVLISDRFDESLVLLRRFLNWKLQDIVYLKRNVNSDKMKNSTDWKSLIYSKNYTKEALELFSKWEAMDIILYRRSLEIFEAKLKNETKFEQEVSAFRVILESVSAFCYLADSDLNHTRPLKIVKNEWTEQFEMNRKECQLMKMREVAIVQKTKNVQSKRRVAGSVT